MGPIGAEQSDVLDRMLVNGRALLELINMTLDINRLEAGRVVTEVSEFDLEDVFDELRSELVMRAAEKQIALTWPPPVSTLPLLRTDRGKLKVVLRNLVDNAIKFTSKGSVAISSHYNADLERLYLTVQDTGVGVPEESLSQIFEMFRQLERSRLSSRGGVGLGLYLVQRYVGLLGGQVNVRSVLGQGSTFLVELPVLLELRS